MNLTKRELMKLGIGGTGLLMASPLLSTSALAASPAGTLPVKGPGTPPSPITVAERKDRVAKAQRLMQATGIGALLIEPGSGMIYFSGIRWWRSERMTALIIPAEGEIAVITPYFEEPSIRESLAFGDDVRTWNENENPFRLVAGVLRDRGVLGRPLAMEETVRHFIVTGIREASPALEIVSGAAIARGCRMHKTPAEIALMQHANDITLDAYRATHQQVAAGMASTEISAIMARETVARGGTPVFQMALIGEASAYPHGLKKPTVVREGEMILMDSGCSYEDYESDISRSFVYGEPTARQAEVWNTVRRGQQMAFEAARVGTPAGEVDSIVRSYYESLGYGPGYKTPGTPHRLGHGIGMDGHEPVNLVEGEKTPLAPGMCFSNEPGIYIYGEFGVRLEDCFHMTDSGPEWFTRPPRSLDDPI